MTIVSIPTQRQILEEELNNLDSFYLLMKQVKLKALDLTVKLGDYQFLHDEGYVKHLGSAVRKLERSELPDFILKHVVKSAEYWRGVCTQRFDEKTGDQHVFIMYTKQNTEEQDYFVRGHEETHALDKLGRLRFLFYDMLRNATIPPVVQFFRHDEEGVADKGGDFAVSKRFGNYSIS